MIMIEKKHLKDKYNKNKARNFFFFFSLFLTCILYLNYKKNLFKILRNIKHIFTLDENNFFPLRIHTDTHKLVT